MNDTIVGCESADASRGTKQARETARKRKEWQCTVFTLMLKMRRKMASNKGGGETLTSKVMALLVSHCPVLI